MGETSKILPVRLQDLMREQEHQSEHGFETRVDSRSLSELLQEEEEINADVVVEADERREGEKIMEGLRGGRRWRSFKERLKIRGMGCCGSSWTLGSENMNMKMKMGEDSNTDNTENDRNPVGVESKGDEMMIGIDGCVGHNPAVEEGSGGETGRSFSATLAAERHFRAAQEWEPVNMGSPLRVSLLRLLEEGDGGGNGGELLRVEESGGIGLGVDGERSCCVCMARRRGAAFIPCGHTFCRVCSRELWLNRGSCPLCNRSIFFEWVSLISPIFNFH